MGFGGGGGESGGGADFGGFSVGGDLSTGGTVSGGPDLGDGSLAGGNWGDLSAGGPQLSTGQMADGTIGGGNNIGGRDVAENNALNAAIASGIFGNTSTDHDPSAAGRADANLAALGFGSGKDLLGIGPDVEAALSWALGHAPLTSVFSTGQSPLAHGLTALNFAGLPGALFGLPGMIGGGLASIAAGLMGESNAGSLMGATGEGAPVGGGTSAGSPPGGGMGPSWDSSGAADIAANVSADTGSPPAPTETPAVPGNIAQSSPMQGLPQNQIMARAAQIRNRFSQMGLSGSTMERQELANLYRLA